MFNNREELDAWRATIDPQQVEAFLASIPAEATSAQATVIIPRIKDFNGKMFDRPVSPATRQAVIAEIKARFAL